MGFCFSWNVMIIIRLMGMVARIVVRFRRIILVLGEDLLVLLCAPILAILH